MSYSGKHAECYDLFYRDKPYHEEAKYAAELIKVRFPEAKTILDLGCGTGLRSLELGRLGYKVTGIDRSPAMLDAAHRHLSAAQNLSPGLIEFQMGNITTFRATPGYDAVISLFHVFSYLTTEADLKKALECCFSNLVSGGVLLFDYWHGPGVEKDPPTVRTKVAENDSFRVGRTAIPQVLSEEHLVNLAVSLHITDKKRGTSRDNEELYTMRYWFPDELEMAVKRSGFVQIRHYSWMSESAPGPESWQACTIALKPRVIVRDGPPQW